MTAKKKTTKSNAQKKPAVKLKKAKAVKKPASKKIAKAKKSTTAAAKSSSASKKASSKKSMTKAKKASSPKSKKPLPAVLKKSTTKAKKVVASAGDKKAKPEKKKPELTGAQKQKLIAKIHKVLKGHYAPKLPNTSRPLPDPSRAALSLRRALQSVFESTYEFSLEHAKKHSVSNGVKTLDNLRSLTPFTKVFVISTALGGHGVPLDHGAVAVLYLSGLVSFEEYQQVSAPGLDRMVTKKIGREFSSLLHQFGADLLLSLHGVKAKKILAEITTDTKERMPKRGEKLPEPLISAVAATSDGDMSEQFRPAGPQAAPRPAGKTPQPPPGSGPKRDADGTPIGTRSGPKPFVVKPNKARSITIKPELAAQREAAEREALKAKSDAKKLTKDDGKQAGKKSGTAAKAEKKTTGHTRKLAKKKPR